MEDALFAADAEMLGLYRDYLSEKNETDWERTRESLFIVNRRTKLGTQTKILVLEGTHHDHTGTTSKEQLR